MSKFDKILIWFLLTMSIIGAFNIHKNNKIRQYRKDNIVLENKIIEKNKRINKLNKYKNFVNELKKSERCYYVTTTMYNAKRNQTDSSPFVTADNTNFEGKDINNLHFIAISWDLHSRYGGPFEFGDKVLLLNAGHKNGIYIIKDLMNRRFRRRIDILEHNNSKQYKFYNSFIVSLDNVEDYHEYTALFSDKNKPKG